MADDNSSNENPFRARLGMYVVIGSSLGVIILGIVVMVAAWHGGKDSPVKETAQLLFTSMLPLLGTWVGTVLAFYFTKDSLEAASRTTLETVRTGRSGLPARRSAAR